MSATPVNTPSKGAESFRRASSSSRESYEESANGTPPKDELECLLTIPDTTYIWDDVPTRPAGQSSVSQSVFNSTNLLMGVGILSLPYSLRLSGWAGGVLLLVLAVITNYTAILLGKMLEHTPGMASYPDIGQVAFGRFGRYFICSIVYMELFTACVMYVIIEGDNLHKLWDHFTREQYSMMSVAVVLPTVYLRRMHVLSYFSLLGNLCVYVLIGLVVATGLMPPDSPLEHPAATSPVVWKTSPLAIGMVMMGFAGHAVFPNIYCDMKRPEKYPRMLTYTYCLTLIGYGTMAVVGYLMYGEGTMKEITLNFKTGALCSTALVLVVVIPLTKFALTIAPVALGIEEAIEPSMNKCLFAISSIVLRTVLAGGVLIVAIKVPYFDRVVSFAGAFLSFNVSVFFPVACHLKLYWREMRWWQRVWDSLLAILAAGCIVLGTAATVLIPDPAS